MAWLAWLATAAFGADLSASQQALLLLKILPYDRHLAERCPDTLTVAILQGHRAREAPQIEEALEGLTAAGVRVDGRPVQVAMLAYEGVEQLAADLTEGDIVAVYLAGRIEPLAELIALTRSHDVLTISPDPDDVHRGISIGLIAKGDRAKVLVNLPASREEGVDFHASFLGLAEVIR